MLAVGKSVVVGNYIRKIGMTAVWLAAINLNE